MAATSGQYYEYREDTPESTRARRKLIESMLGEATKFEPAYHWSQAAVKGLQGLLGGYQLGQLAEEEKADRGAAQGQVEGAFGPGRKAPIEDVLGSGSGGTGSPAAPTPAATAPLSAPMRPVAPVPPSAEEMAAGAPRAAYGMPDYERAVKTIESGSAAGNYGLIGPVVRRADGTVDRAYGAHQVMGSNIPTWTKEVLGREMTPAEFLNSPEAQDAVFRAKFGQFVEKHGNPRDAAAVWFSGRPIAADTGRPDVLGTTVPAYVAKFDKALSGGQRASPAASPAAVAAGVPADSFAPAGEALTAEAPATVSPPRLPGVPTGTSANAMGLPPTATAVASEDMSKGPVLPPIAPYLQQAAQRNPALAALAASRIADPASVAFARQELAKEAMMLRERDPAIPMSPEQRIERATKEAGAQKEIQEAEKIRRENLKTRTGAETAAAVTGILQQARQLPVDYGREAFERATGTYINRPSGPFYEDIAGSVLQPITQGVAEIGAAIKGGARPGEIQDAVRSTQANLVAILGPSVRAPGAQSNYELKQIESQAGALGNSTSIEDFNRRIDRLESSVETFLTRFSDPVKILRTQAGPRSPNAPLTAEQEAPLIAGKERGALAGAGAVARSVLPEFMGGYSPPAAPQAPQQPIINRASKRDRLRDIMMGAAQ